MKRTRTDTKATDAAAAFALAVLRIKLDEPRKGA